MNYYSLLLSIMVCSFSIACNEKPENKPDPQDVYDIILVAGQSNTLNGAGIIPAIDSSSDGIFQLGRHGKNNMSIIDAIEPLDHHDKRDGKIGFSLTFAKLYKNAFLKQGRKLLIIPCGKGSTGFYDHGWNCKDPLYADAVERVNEVCRKYPGSLLVAVLWHQGEHDVKNKNYRSQLDRMVVDLRNDIQSWDEPRIFIAGGMVPYWVNKQDDRKICNHIIRQLPDRIPYTGFSDSEYPSSITKKDNEIDDVHFDAEGQREMGRRYFSEYCRLRN